MGTTGRSGRSGRSVSFCARAGEAGVACSRIGRMEGGPVQWATLVLSDTKGGRPVSFLQNDGLENGSSHLFWLRKPEESKRGVLAKRYDHQVVVAMW